MLKYIDEDLLKLEPLIFENGAGSLPGCRRKRAAVSASPFRPALRDPFAGVYT
jgi:hypothetical protein